MAAEWFARPVLHVRDVDAAVRFYVEKLGFAKAWQYEALGKGLTFVSIEPAALDALRMELEGRGVEVRDGEWGYRIVIVEDLDGNLMYFNYPNEDG